MTSTQHQLTPSRVGPRSPDPAAAVYAKLAFFSVALFAAPLSAYYFSKDRLFGGNTTHAGGLAALVVNIVLFCYVVVAFMEDQGDGPSDKKDTQAIRKELQERLRNLDEDELSKKGQ
ncbi:hypothetical protein CBS101457_002321 [Exobasidium rhododendri]|nr:hypothetical protein CBS101457_002321 [Exobasidium rhododendri]